MKEPTILDMKSSSDTKGNHLNMYLRSSVCCIIASCKDLCSSSESMRSFIPNIAITLIDRRA